MKKIKLTQGKFALVDDEDFWWLNQWKWRYSKAGKGYAIRTDYSNGKKDILIHRLIVNADKKEEVDHKNHNSLDNRRNNLRICTHSENLLNMDKPITNRSGFRGVCWIKDRKIWEAKIKINGKTIRLGRALTKRGAITLYKEKFTNLFPMIYANF